MIEQEICLCGAPMVDGWCTVDGCACSLTHTAVDDWPLISVYTRAQAIDDGVLVDCGSFMLLGARVVDVVGFKYPVAMTAAAYGSITEGCAPGTRENVIALAGCLGVLHSSITLREAAELETDRIHFIYVPYRDSSERVKLWAMCGPGDDANPVLTIMLEGED